MRISAIIIYIGIITVLYFIVDYFSKNAATNLNVINKMEHTETITKKGNLSLPSSSDELSKLINYENGEYKYSVEDFFKKPKKTAYQLSPDGNYFSYMGPFENRQNLFIQKIGDSTAIQVTHETDRDIAGYLWANNDRLLYIKDDGGDENFKLFAVSKDGNNPKNLTPFDEIRIQFIDRLENNDDEVIIGMNKDNKQLFDPYRININTGAFKQLAKNNPMTPFTDWQTDHDGKLRLAFKVVDGINMTLLHRTTEESEWEESITTNWKESIAPLFFDFENPNQIYATSNLGRDKSAIVKFDLTTGKEIEKIFEHDQVDVYGLSYSKKRKVLTTISYTTDKKQHSFLDKKVEDLYQELKNQLGDYEIFISSKNKEEDKFIIRTYSDRSLGAYYFYEAQTGNLTKIADVSPWIDEEDLSEMIPVSYQSRDGLEIKAYLTLPKDKNKNLPAIVLPHGGPSARDAWGYRPDVQLLANRGYAVLQMNFRGSTGYGKAFWMEGFRKWGEEMQDDITDGVNWMVEQGIADARKVGIYGGSYGGYATLAGLTFTPDVYACGVDYVGVSNIFTILENIPPYWEPYRKMMYEMIGDPTDEKDSLRMEKYSPVLQAHQITAPLLVVQGANDPRVKILESDQMVEALRNRDIDVPYMVKYNEGHGFSNEENQFEFYKVMLGFLAKHLKEDWHD